MRSPLELMTRRLRVSLPKRAVVLLALALAAFPTPAFTQSPSPTPLQFPPEVLECLRRELTEAGFTSTTIEDLLGGRIADPESFVTSRIGAERTEAIERACFRTPPPTETSTPSPTPIDLPEEKITCLRTELAGVGFTQGEIDDLFAGRIDDPQAFVEGRIGQEGIERIGRACFPEYFEEPSPVPTAPTEREVPTLTPEQRACVTRFIDAEILDLILEGEVDPEEVLSPEQMREIGQACFGEEVAEHATAPPIPELPPEIAACLKDAVGEEAFAEVMSGRRSPTPEEIAKGEQCFPTPPPGAVTRPPELPDEITQCVIGILGPERFHRIISGTVQPETVATPEEMRRVGETCFGGPHPPPPEGVPPGGVPPEGGPPPEIIACVEGILGKPRTAELLRGSPPTAEEMEKAKSCFPEYTPPPGGGPGGHPPSVAEIPPEVRACLEGLFGANRLNDFLSGRAQPTPADIERANTCLGGPRGGPTPVPAGEPPPGGLPPETEACLKDALGADRFRELLAGRAQPSTEEMPKIQACFGQTSEPVPTGPPTEEPTTTTDTPSGPAFACASRLFGEARAAELFSGRGAAATEEEIARFNAECTEGPPPAQEPAPEPDGKGEASSDPAQCIAACTGASITDAEGNTRTYTEEECRQLCSGTVQGAATERQGNPWYLDLLLNLFGF